MVENSVGIITAISPYVGYNKASAYAKEAIHTGVYVKDLILKEKLFSKEDLEQILDPYSMTEPGISGKLLSKSQNAVV